MSEKGLGIGIILLISLSIITLRSIAPEIFPLYFLYYIIAIALYIFFSKIEFDVWSVFYKYFYIGSLALLILPLIVGQVTRGVIRWINVGPFSLQPTEIVRPLLLLVFAVFITKKRVGFMRLFQASLIFAIPVFLILIQPSLGVSILTIVGFIGVLIGSAVDKKILTLYILFGFLVLPLGWLIAPVYQKERITSFFYPTNNSSGSYHAIQSTIAVGSGKLNGRGLGEGIQTQLAFLPERQTDFIFASIAEELGFVGAVLVVVGSNIILYKIIVIMDQSANATARAFISGVFFTLLSQVFVHIGMNMGMLPITGITLPLVSAGGSSLVSTTILLGMVVGAKRKV